MNTKTTVVPAEIPTMAPPKAGLVLATLIVVSAVANLPLAMANVALPSIGAYFDASQTQLNLVAVGYSLGLACSVLWLGALGDRYGRKMMLLLGVTLAIPAALIAGFAPSIEILIGARIFGGIAAGMAFPTCLALIAALWAGPARTRSIALWAAMGGAINALRPAALRDPADCTFPGTAVFLVVIPVAVVALFMALKFIPAHVNESTESVDNLGGILSMVLVGSFILAINFAPVPNMGTLVLGLVVVAVVALVLFVIRQRRAKNPLYDLKVAARPTFWVAAVGGIIVFGSLMGAMFLGPAVHAERARLLDRGGRRRDSAGGALHDPGGAAFGQAGAGAGLTLHLAAQLCVRLDRLRAHAVVVERRHSLLDGRDRLYLPRHRRRAGRHAFLEFADGLGAGDAGGHGVRHGGPAARPGRCADAVDLRGAAGDGFCRGHGDRHCGIAGPPTSRP